MVHSGVYLNKYVVSIAPFSTPACPDCSQNIQKTALFCMFSLYNFSSIFQVGQRTPFVPVCGRPWAGLLWLCRIQFNSEEQWTKALKFMLTNLKWGLAWVSSQFANK